MHRGVGETVRVAGRDETSGPDTHWNPTLYAIDIFANSISTDSWINPLDSARSKRSVQDRSRKSVIGNWYWRGPCDVLRRRKGSSWITERTKSFEQHNLTTNLPTSPLEDQAAMY